MYARQRKEGYLQGKGERVTCCLHTCTHSRLLFNVLALHEQDEDSSPVSPVLRASQRVFTWHIGVSAIRVIADAHARFYKVEIFRVPHILHKYCPTVWVI